MDLNKQSQAVTAAVFGALIVVPVIIGLSVYSRTEPAPTPPPVPVPAVRPVAVPVSQNFPRTFYISGYAYDSVTYQPLVNSYLVVENAAGVFTQTDGNFSVPVTSSSSYVTLVIGGYKPKMVSVNPSGNGVTSQELGTVMFEPESTSLSYGSPVALYTQVDPTDRLNKLYYTNSAGAQVKLNDDNILSFKQSPDLLKVTYVSKENVDGSLRVMTVKINTPYQKTGPIYTETKPDTKINIVGWTKDSNSVVWVSENVKVVSWGTAIEYYNLSKNTLGYILNPQTGNQLFEKVEKTEISPSKQYFAAQYLYRHTSGKLYSALLFEDLDSGVLSGVVQSNETANLKGFFFDDQNRLNYWLFYPKPATNNWLRWDPVTGSTDTYYDKPAFWNGH